MFFSSLRKKPRTQSNRARDPVAKCRCEKWGILIQAGAAVDSDREGKLSSAPFPKTSFPTASFTWLQKAASRCRLVRHSGCCSDVAKHSRFSEHFAAS